MKNVFAVASVTLLLVAVATAGHAVVSQDPLDSSVDQPLGHEAPHAVFISTVDGIHQSTTVDGLLLASAPQWSTDSQSPPPIEVRQVVELSRVVLRSVARDPEQWGVVQIALERINKYWLYLVRWRPKTGGTKDFVQIPVLLSGRAISPDSGHAAKEQPR